MKPLQQSAFERLAATLHGPALAGFVAEHEARGGEVHLSLRVRVLDECVARGELLAVIADLFGGGA